MFLLSVLRSGFVKLPILPVIEMVLHLSSNDDTCSAESLEAKGKERNKTMNVQSNSGDGDAASNIFIDNPQYRDRLLMYV